MSSFIVKMYRVGYYTKENMNLFLKVGYLTKEDYDSVISQ